MKIYAHIDPETNYQDIVNTFTRYAGKNYWIKVDNIAEPTPDMQMYIRVFSIDPDGHTFEFRALWAESLYGGYYSPLQIVSKSYPERLRFRDFTAQYKLSQPLDIVSTPDLVDTYYTYHSKGF